MRSILKGLISFGLVNIPVGLYSAVEDKDLSFNQLHKEDGGRVTYNKVCKVCGQVLSADDIVKGYEYDKGKYVTLTDEDFEQVARAATRAIAIQDFVDASEIDPLYFDRAYYLGPDEAGKMPYVLLREAMQRTNKVGVAKLVMRDKEHLAIIRPVEGALVLNTMHYPDEIRKAEGVGIPGEEVQVGDRELDMAELLVKSMTGEWQPDKYQDEYRQEMMQMIEAKLEGVEYQAEPQAQHPTNVVDIMSTLKASIEEAEKGREKTATG